MVAALGIAGIRERVRRQPAESALVDHDVHILDEIGRRRAAVAPDPEQVARLDHSTIGLRSAGRRWCTPSESMTVPSAKIWRNIPNWLPSLERPRASRVKSGSAAGDRGLTRGLGESRCAGPAAADRRRGHAGSGAIRRKSASQRWQAEETGAGWPEFAAEPESRP